MGASEWAWEGLVAEAALRTSFNDLEIAWLVDRAGSAPRLGYRMAESLARVIAIVAQRHPEARPSVAIALLPIFEHPAPSVRVAALEAMLELDVDAAKRLARRVTDSDHPSLREAARSVIAMVA